MLYYIKKYPISIFIIAVVIYLSFYRPSSSSVISFPHLDKIVHFCMYLGVSGMLWLEFCWVHRKDNARLWHAWVGACLCPILFSGCVELMQENLTDYRGGEWADFAANSLGAIVASLIGYFVLRPYISKRFGSSRPH